MLKFKKKVRRQKVNSNLLTEFVPSCDLNVALQHYYSPRNGYTLYDDYILFVALQRFETWLHNSPIPQHHGPAVRDTVATIFPMFNRPIFTLQSKQVSL